ncbi:Sir2 family NAD-dependent protein deacetylase [Actinomyces minihominis]|uniref:Sir2 family NAD-dependent protein deacetylase n=1 Tax=Actinomyces minihominis TaxID=2002838 RepID=UPI000C07049A|nr:Sir2 family NAD-dependent protein deacetylase [Actinomyces minihominis]
MPDFETAPNESQLDLLVDLFDHGPVALITGAGVSTDSGIPDYRGQGTPPRTPMSVHQFSTEHRYRQRFWGGARIGTEHWKSIQPNDGHRAVARLEAAGLLSGVITQNTDGLHRRAGSKKVAELHGNGSIMRCVENGHRWNREETLAWFDVANPGFVEKNRDAQLTPDGDADVRDVDEVVVPICPACGGQLRPDVVYFGEHVPTTTFALAEEILAGAGALLVAGSSLAVNTPIRVINRAEARDLPIGIINRGPTAIDSRPSIAVRIEGGTTDWLGALAGRLGA